MTAPTDTVDIGFLERWADSLERAATSPHYTDLADTMREKADHLRRAIAALKDRGA